MPRARVCVVATGRDAAPLICRPADSIVKLTLILVMPRSAETALPLKVNDPGKGPVAMPKNLKETSVAPLHRLRPSNRLRGLIQAFHALMTVGRAACTSCRMRTRRWSRR